MGADPFAPENFDLHRYRWEARTVMDECRERHRERLLIEKSIIKGFEMAVDTLRSDGELPLEGFFILQDRLIRLKEWE